MASSSRAVELPRDLHQFAEAEVKAGRFGSVSEVVERAVAEFQKLEVIRQDFAEAREEFAHGDGIELTAEELSQYLRNERPRADDSSRE